MPESPLIAAGAQIPPTSAAPLHTNEWFTGMWTQGNPLGSGAVPFLYQKFYSAMRYDRLVGGKNTEVTSRLSLARRPGSLIYNSVNFPPISRFYEFRAFQGGQERIHILADVEGTSFGPATLTIASVQVGYFPVGHGSFEWLIYVVFTSNLPPLQSGQTYTFSGVTNYPALNSQTLTRVRFGPGGNDCYFESSVLAPYGPAADTGNAVVTNAVLFGGSVRDVTGPSTDLTLWNKDQSAGRTSFQSVGNIVFFGDGVNANKWVTSALQWIAATSYSRGNFFVDPNNNMQLAVGSQTSTITDISVTANVATVFFSSASQLRIPVGTKLTFAGCTTIAALNGTTKTVTIVENGQQVSFALTHADLAFSVETGTATTGTGITGSSQPTWATGFGAITQDGGEQWENRGTSVEKWGIETSLPRPRRRRSIRHGRQTPGMLRSL